MTAPNTEILFWEVRMCEQVASGVITCISRIGQVSGSNSVRAKWASSSKEAGALPISPWPNPYTQVKGKGPASCGGPSTLHSDHSLFRDKVRYSHTWRNVRVGDSFSSSCPSMTVNKTRIGHLDGQGGLKRRDSPDSRALGTE
jgi:hypothetical protein